MKSILFFTTVILALSSCKKITCEPQDLTSEEVYKSQLYGAGDENIDESNLVIKTQEEWNDLLDKMDAVNDESSNFATNIDFDSKMIIACFDKVQSNGGYDLNISSVEHNGEHINIEVTKSNAGGMTTQVINQPYEIITVTKCDSEVVFN